MHHPSSFLPAPQMSGLTPSSPQFGHSRSHSWEDTFQILNKLSRSLTRLKGTKVVSNQPCEKRLSCRKKSNLNSISNSNFFWFENQDSDWLSLNDVCLLFTASRSVEYVSSISIRVAILPENEQMLIDFTLFYPSSQAYFFDKKKCEDVTKF